ncbi:OadG family protein [Glaciecola sp. MH2013]|uniref:OadG family transporter subunit n=1 Tax=Glaciecola sp. MH2013 TaxID=2785524 RepID=UPI0018A10AB7|nr:OadG family transporter subunit [Glaciecola sp. MH2013]MBF7072408.1 OadG family protein [Glaciecola sp. MH2013]
MAEQLMEAGVLLAVGMSVVFAFLTLLIAGIHLIAWFERAFPSPIETPSTRPRQEPKQKNDITEVSPQIAAAISAAVSTHRKSTSK